jgi:aminoglycoside phosphotransferase (APT) family kinase protein
MTEKTPVAAALCNALSAEFGCPMQLNGDLEPIGGGFWATIFGFELVDPPAELRGPLVVRIMPDRTAGERETFVQRWLAASGFSTPIVAASGTADGLGEAYMVMRRAAGSPPLAGLQLGKTLLRLRSILANLPTLLAHAAAELHALNPDPLTSELVAAGVSFPTDPASRFLTAFERASSTFQRSHFDDLHAWFELSRVGPDTRVICHGDLHPLNILVDPTGAVTVLDWTNAAIGPREMDIGFSAGLLRCAPIAVPRPLRPVIDRITNGLAERFIDSYRQRSGVDDDAVIWWEALQYGRCLAELTHGRLNPGSIVGPAHPFEVAAPAMQRRLRELTGVAIELPERVP